ncbi:MAG TPA: OmpA family protein [Ignavibacteriales bacterium]|nr:OmpA family protein [Ignavibacteriales bacterium]HOL80381.1 OmpA family protein [Ignavibacteriales bacterium]HOM64832.1 OmpA family protein [Ignavibacteriales bacterium]HPD67435.1 OmpA family protein [Ignavibacteriales bacterium]HPP32570.1 OmpA family protein [Ignavibacteriales bacterium]
MKSIKLFLILLFFTHLIHSQVFYKPHILSSKFGLSAEGGISAPRFDYYSNRNDYIGRFSFEYYIPTTSVGIFGFKVLGGGGYLNVKFPKTQVSNINPLELRNSYYYGETQINYTFSISDVFLPYFGTGIAVLEYTLYDIDGNQVPKYTKFDSRELQVVGEVGLRIMLASNLSLNLSAHTNISPNDRMDNLVTGKNDFFNSAFAGVTFYFGGKKDTDGDGIYDDVDQCPDQPEDFDGFQDDNGCPDPDNDGDGIFDLVDKCPNQPEDFDGFQDDDGCPDLDNDGDGILDVNDKCPNQPEDFDGFQDDDGCPDPDNDGDGILDIYDKCPDLPETYNGIDDTDGCPDGFTPEVKVDTIFITKFVQQNIPSLFEFDANELFAANTNTFGPKAGLFLDTLVTFFKENNNTNWRIECYTDAKVKNAKKLATDRALAIRDYFSARNIEKTRFTVYGMGSVFPKVVSKDPQQLLKNNRIIIIRTK